MTVVCIILILYKAHAQLAQKRLENMQVQDWSGQTWFGKLVPVEESVPDMTFHGVLPVMCHVVAVHLPLSHQR